MTIPVRTFVMRDDATPYGNSVIGRKMSGSKQNLLRHDALHKRNIIIHGDFTNRLHSDSAAGMVWAYDPIVDVVDASPTIGLTQISDMCHGPGQVTHFGGNDGASAGVDYRDNVLWTTPGSTFGYTHGATCSTPGNGFCSSTPGSTFYLGLEKMDLATGLWTGVSQSASVQNVSLKGGEFDPVQRCLIGVAGSDLITRVFVDSLTKSEISVNYSALGVPFPGTYSAGGDEIEVAFDWVGRYGYFFGAGRPNPADPQPWRYYLIRFNLDNPSQQTKLADPPFIPPLYVNGYVPTHIRGLQFDTRNRKVLWFYRRTAGGRKVHGVVAFDPTTGAWEAPIPIVQTPAVGLGAITGGTIGYDSTNNVFIGFGSAGYSAGEDPMNQESDIIMGYYWLWRYA